MCEISRSNLSKHPQLTDYRPPRVVFEERLARRHRDAYWTRVAREIEWGFAHDILYRVERD